ncbi:hypothetical protein O6H91_20G071500 [Diphasiastrum complanatum]|uniref:Uncharacterized protein n=1 Tax=Diphasiastrum complanatum TaxID=34168 RepID=A0ACC2ARM0_DIPCM|nr:hypothetical protein O6H91_20G071500 [Diphasiastrum complanatum]
MTESWPSSSYAWQEAWAHDSCPNIIIAYLRHTINCWCRQSRTLHDIRWCTTFSASGVSNGRFALRAAPSPALAGLKVRTFHFDPALFSADLDALSNMHSLTAI